MVAEPRGDHGWRRYVGDPSFWLGWDLMRSEASSSSEIPGADVTSLSPLPGSLLTSRTPSALSPGVVRQVRPIVGPFHAVLKLEMNYVVGGVVSHRNVVNVHIFVSEYWF